MPDGYEQLQQQIEQMRREMAQARARYRAASVVAAALVLGSLTVARGWSAQEPAARELAVTKLTVVSQDGKPAMVLSSDKDGGTLNLNDAAGSKCVYIGSDADGGYLRVQDTENKRASILAIGENSGLVNVYNREDKNAIFLGATKNGAGTLEANGADGKIRASLATDEDGGALWTRNNDGKVLAFFGAAKGGNGGYAALKGPGDKDGVILAGTSAKGGGLINVNLPNGNTGVILDAQPNVGGQVELRDTNNNARASYPSR